MTPRKLRRSAQSRRLVATMSAAALALSLTFALGPASASITFGSLSNFDVFNDTGQETYGFEIELDGLSSADVTYTFGAPYERYGNPKVVDFVGANGQPGVYVRYESPYDPVAKKFTQATPVAPTPITPTAGHACYNGGPIGNYLTSGCEHFGVALNRNPTATVYRWLVADPANPGALQPAGTRVSIPAPVWNVAPVPGPANQPVVQAVVPAPPVEQAFEFGDAQWVKVFVQEAPEKVELHHLVTDDPVVPQEAAEVEIEWVLLQADVNGAGGNNELNQEGEMGASNESVTRRYEFYKYTGLYDPETHEALCEDPTSGNEQACGPEVDGLAGVGDYIGAQNVAVNVNLNAGPGVDITSSPANPSASRSAEFRFQAGQASTFVCQLDGAPLGPATACRPDPADPGNLARGAKSYAGLADGPHTFTVTASDPDGNSSSRGFSWIVDATRPLVVFEAPGPAANASGWNNTDVSIAFAIHDTGSGVDAGNSTSSPLVLSGEGAAVKGSVTATDTAGNTGTVFSPAVKIDRTAPTVNIVQPADGATFVLGHSVTASYSCSDALSGIATCAGPVANGSAIDTGSSGSKSFVVSATDKAGNPTQQTVGYTVLGSDGGSGFAIAWVGLNNSDDVGSTFDLKAELYSGGILIGSGQVNAVKGASSGFNNAKSGAIPLTLSGPIPTGSALSVTLSARITCSGASHRSATARLWFNDAQANSGFGASVGQSSSRYYLVTGKALGTSPGAGPKKTVDIFLDSSRACPARPFLAFGTWSLASP